MSPTKVMTTAILAASVAAGSLIPLSSAANARDWNGHRDGYRDGPHIERVEPREHSRLNRWGEPRRDYGRHRDWQDRDVAQYHHRKKDRTARNVAIGIFAAMLGLAIASEASRANHYDGYRD